MCVESYVARLLRLHVRTLHSCSQHRSLANACVAQSRVHQCAVCARILHFENSRATLSLWICTSAKGWIAIFKWEQHPELREELLRRISQAETGGNTRTQVFESFARSLSSQFEVAMTPRAVETYFRRLSIHRSARTSNATATKPKRRRVSNRQAVIDRVRVLIAGGAKRTPAYQKVSEEQGVKLRTVRSIYEQWERSSAKVQDRATAVVNSTPAAENQDQLLDSLIKFFKYSDYIPQFDLAVFLQSLAALAEGVAKTGQGVEHKLHIENLQEEVTKLRVEVAGKEEKCRSLEVEMKQMRDELETVQEENQAMKDTVRFAWTNWQTGDGRVKVVGLGEFERRMIHFVEKFGVLERTETEIRSKS